MCGIFGIALRQGVIMSSDKVRKLISNLYVLSESRGKESAGIHIYLPDAARAWTLKGAQSASELLRTEAYEEALTQSLLLAYGKGGSSSLLQPMIVLAHSRLVTNGTSSLDRNNQPVRCGDVTMIHNGIVVNVDKLWQANSDLQRTAEVDTEVMAAIVNKNLQRDTFDSVSATRGVFGQINGAASIAWTHRAAPVLTLATNTGDLYTAALPNESGLVFASERYILLKSLEKTFDENRAGAIKHKIEWVQAGNGLSLDLDANGPAAYFTLAPDNLNVKSSCRMRTPAEHHDTGTTDRHRAPDVLINHADESLVRFGEERIRSLRRCSCCVLPETFPFIEFDDKGVCNYCRSYKPRYAGMHPTETRKAFIESLEKYRRSGNEPDVLVPFSGGRDSSYGLHLIHKEFGLRPVTFTYDWGMVTDLARRNVARMCGQLGIQNILVSADIKSKRDNIRKNVAAWLKQPDLGMVPLFMAGDKHFFRIVNQLKRQTGISLDLWCANPLENTDFKSGFCGVRPDFDKSRVDYLSMGRKVHLAAYYGTRFLSNPSYLNGSLLDTFGAFLAYYFEPRRDFYNIFDHFMWNEEEVNTTLLSTYDWEIATDTPSTWRIGDGTAPFYNYIYMTARGFSEFDTFRSNQIREGHITRDQALDSIAIENRPRTESIRWYLETIGLDFNDTIKRVNEMDKWGLHQ
jgi:asparagine synthetase B (glutamine-hydrolysing)